MTHIVNCAFQDFIANIWSSCRACIVSLSPWTTIECVPPCFFTQNFSRYRHHHLTSRPPHIPFEVTGFLASLTDDQREHALVTLRTFTLYTLVVRTRREICPAPVLSVRMFCSDQETPTLRTQRGHICETLTSGGGGGGGTHAPLQSPHLEREVTGMIQGREKAEIQAMFHVDPDFLAHIVQDLGQTLLEQNTGERGGHAIHCAGPPHQVLPG